MPNIRQYENDQALTARLDPGTAVAAGNSALGAARVRADTMSQFGRQIGSTVEDLGEKYQEYRAQQEISQGLPTSAQFLARKTDDWNNIAAKADPNDPSTSQKFLNEDLEPQLQEWVGSFQTKRGRAWAESQAGSMRNHFFEKTSADQMAQAGVAAVQNVTTARDALTRLAQSDPSATGTAIAQWKMTLDGVIDAANLSPVQAARLRGELEQAGTKEITVAAATRIARDSPELAMKMIDEGRLPGNENLDASDRERLRAYADGQKSAKEQDARVAKAQALQDGKLQFERKLLSIAPRLNDGGQLVYPAGYAASLEALKQDPAADLEKINSAGQAYQAAVKEDLGGVLIASDPVLRAAYIDRISSTTNPLNDAEVYAARAKGLLGKDDFSLFLGAAQGEGAGGMGAAQRAGWSRVKDLKSRYKPIVTGSAGPLGMTPLGAARWAEFSNYIDSAYQGATGPLGKTPEEATVMIQKDIDLLAQRYAVMGPEAMRSTQNFMRGTPESGAVPVPGASKGPRSTHTYEGLTGGGGGSAASDKPKIKPGESAADYLKRVRGQ